MCLFYCCCGDMDVEQGKKMQQRALYALLLLIHRHTRSHIKKRNLPAGDFAGQVFVFVLKLLDFDRRFIQKSSDYHFYENTIVSLHSGYSPKRVSCMGVRKIGDSFSRFVDGL